MLKVGSVWDVLISLDIVAHDMFAEAVPMLVLPALALTLTGV